MALPHIDLEGGGCGVWCRRGFVVIVQREMMLLSCVLGCAGVGYRDEAEEFAVLDAVASS